MSDEAWNRYQSVLSRISAAAIASGRDPSSVRLIAVSKTQAPEAIEALYGAGHRDFGENYAQELVEKAVALSERGCDGIRWHFIGHLQTNKIRSLLPHVFCVHSVDSEKLVRELARNWQKASRAGRLPVFIEVNVSAEESKSGVTPEAAPRLAALTEEFREIELRGLMCVPSAEETGEALSRRFAELRELERKCRPASQGDLSMGMSGDFELAITQGATHVRVGTALFGARQR